MRDPISSQSGKQSDDTEVRETTASCKRPKKTTDRQTGTIFEAQSTPAASLRGLLSQPTLLVDLEQMGVADFLFFCVHNTTWSEISKVRVPEAVIFSWQRRIRPR